MKKTIFAGVLALAAIAMLSGTSGAFAGDRTGMTVAQVQQAAAVDIARIKRVLMLTSEQEGTSQWLASSLQKTASYLAARKR